MDRDSVESLVDLAGKVLAYVTFIGGFSGMMAIIYRGASSWFRYFRGSRVKDGTEKG